MTDAPQSTGLAALADRIELWPLDRLRPYERNPRTHSDTQVDQIAASMVEFGWTNPILIDENAGILCMSIADRNVDPDPTVLAARLEHEG